MDIKQLQQNSHWKCESINKVIKQDHLISIFKLLRAIKQYKLAVKSLNNHSLNDLGMKKQ